jgi:excisionase family DNA binding protein
VGEMPENLKVGEVARLCRVESSTVRRWIKLGVIPAVKVGRGWLVPRADLEQKLEVER